MQNQEPLSAIRPEQRAPETSQSEFNAGAAYIDGNIVPISEARIPIMDWGFLHSDATYDVVHVWDGRFFRLNDHLDRFMTGVQKLNMTLELSREEMRDILARCVRATGLQRAYVEMICTRGIPAGNSRDPRTCRNRFYAFAIPFSWVATPEEQDRGIRLHISEVQRISPQSVDPTIKNYHWLDLVKGQFEAYAFNAHLSVLVDAGKHVVEGAGFNIFIIKGNTVSTPGTGVLEGITRKTAMELARQLNLDVEERPVHARELAEADEVFITSTAGGIMPIHSVDGKLVGSGRQDKTLQLRALYWEAHSDPALSEPV